MVVVVVAEGRVVMGRPDFIIIGAMKCATSTLHAQLAKLPGVCMSEPKEPNFFSDDEQFARGIGWYESLFVDVGESMCGESSTHYTKLPTHPLAVERMRQHLPDVKLIYVMRHPVDRLISQYIHEWTQRAVSGSINQAVDRLPRLIDYSRYSMQLRPYLDAYGAERILPVFFERVVRDPQVEFERVCRFIGWRGQPRWQVEDDKRNRSSQRLRKSPIRDALVWNPVSNFVRRRFIPQGWRDGIKRVWQMKDRPRLSREQQRKLEGVFDEDLAMLGSWLGADLSCQNYRDTVVSTNLEWCGPALGS